MMTEKEAWEFCAELFLNPVMCGCGCREYGVQFKDTCAIGVCNGLKLGLYYQDKIGVNLYQEMRAKIDGALNGTVFLYPNTEEGAKLRVEFCKRMAKECE